MGQDQDAKSDASDDSDEESELYALICFDPPPEFRVVFENQANITLLRLFLDVDIELIPPMPEKSKVDDKVPLRNYDGFQEVYKGRQVWVYDAASNQDGSVQCVSARGHPQGNIATGDSWRAKARSIWDLQLNLDAGNITELDFHPDPTERARNYEAWGFMPFKSLPVQHLMAALREI